MAVRCLAVVTLAGSLVSGCSWNRVGTPKSTTWEQPQGPVELKARAAQLKSTRVFGSSILLQLAPAPICQQRVWQTEEVEISERNDGRRKFGKAAPILGALMIIGGGALFVSEVTSDEISPVLLPISIATFVSGVGLAILGKPLQRNIHRTRTEHRPGTSVVTETACTDEITYAWDKELMSSYRLYTPWGTVEQGGASPARKGDPMAWFATKMHDAPDLFAGDFVKRILTGWKADLGSGSATSFELTEPQARELVTNARQRAVEHGRVPPAGALEQGLNACERQRAFVAAIESTARRADCASLGPAIDGLRAHHPKAIADLEAWWKSHDADAKLPTGCGFPLDATPMLMLSGCHGDLPAWTYILDLD